MISARLQSNGFYALDGALCVVRSKNFPRKFGFLDGFAYTYVLGIGGNIGDTRLRFERFLHALSKDVRIFVCESSEILKNKAFGFLEQDDFLNATLCVQTSLAPRAMLKIMQRYELKFLRKRSFKNAPRTLDIDILYASARTRPDTRLELPHPGACERISVVYPLGTMKLV